MPQKTIVEVVSPAPVLNIPEFRIAFGGKTGRHIPQNSSGHPLHYEFVALPRTRLCVEEILPNPYRCIYRISLPSYPAPRLYIDSRFTGPVSSSSSPVPLTIPPPWELAERMERLLGTQYVWGGNWSAGIPKLLELYPPTGTIDERTKVLWTFFGVDCSGLLYEVTGGVTPRNTKGLLHFGETIPVAEKSPRQILSLLRPMDWVVWPGHVWFVLNEQFSIESKSPFGVIRRPLLERLEETCRERRGVDIWKASLNHSRHFMIRRIRSGA